MKLSLNKNNYIIKYNHEGKETERIIVAHTIIIAPEPVIVAFCRRSHAMREFKFSNITSIKPWLKDTKALVERIMRGHKKGDF